VLSHLSLITAMSTGVNLNTMTMMMKKVLKVHGLEKKKKIMRIASRSSTPSGNLI
jgi:hypothetical protein